MVQRILEVMSEQLLKVPDEIKKSRDLEEGGGVGLPS